MKQFGAVLILIVVAACAMARTPAETFDGRLALALDADVAARSFTGQDGVLHHVIENGTPGPLAPDEDLQRISALPRAVLLVHGTLYDPSEPGLPNPHATVFNVMRQHIDPQLQPVAFAWYSGPLTFEGEMRALARGALTPYGLAQRTLRDEVPALRRLLKAMPADYVVICHSLGCELVRQALNADDMAPPERLLALSGDFDEVRADDYAARHEIEVLAVRAADDLPLSMSAHRAVSGPYWHDGMARSGQWIDLMFDPEVLQSGGRGAMGYGNLRRYWDHMATFEFAAPWPVYNAFLVSGRQPDDAALAAARLSRIGASRSPATARPAAQDSAEHKTGRDR